MQLLVRCEPAQLGALPVSPAQYHRSPPSERHRAIGTLLLLFSTLSFLFPGLGPADIPIAPPYNNSLYALPWVAGTEHRVIQGNNSLAGSHQGEEAYAWDFVMPIGTLLLADRDGTVTMTKDDSNVGGYNYYLGYDANYVVINHGDGFQSVYLHLMYHGVLVHPGQSVVQGDPIGYSGDTGFAGGPHLHFAVEIAGNANRVTQSVPAVFSDVSSWGGLPLTGRHYVSGNDQMAPAPAVTPVPAIRRPATYHNPFGPYQHQQDFPVPHGHFYMEARGRTAYARSGFLVADDDGIPFSATLDALGGPQAIGYPISQRLQFKGLTTQVFQKLVLQWHPDTGDVQPLNVLDMLHSAGLDADLQAADQIPPPADTSPDTGLPWDDVVTRHQAYLDANPAIKAAYFAAADPVALYGLPVSPVTDEGDELVVRCQRAVFQQWKSDLPWARAGQVTIANAGEIARNAGLFPAAGLKPDPAPIP